MRNRFRSLTCLVVGLLLAGLPLLLRRPKLVTSTLAPADDNPKARSATEMQIDKHSPEQTSTNTDSAKLTTSRSLMEDQIKRKASKMTPEQRARFQVVFEQQIKPAAERWCSNYAGHTPFKPEDITPNKFKEWIFPGQPGEGYAFVVNGTTVTFDIEDGKAILDYVMAPAAARLFQVPSSMPPPQRGSVSMDEVLRLLKEDSGRDFSPEEVMLIPTGFCSSMNGGVQVFAGKGVRGIYGLENAEYNLVFDGSGNLAYYLWNPPPKRVPQPH